VKRENLTVGGELPAGVINHQDKHANSRHIDNEGAFRVCERVLSQSTAKKDTLLKWNMMPLGAFIFRA
jgi:hypothetical protein